MRGFLRALIDTYQRIALGTLEGHLQPWRPTTDHVHDAGAGCAVIKADLPGARRSTGHEPRPWVVGIPVGEVRIDVIRWLDANGAQAAGLAEALSAQLARIKEKTPDAFLIPAVVAGEAGSRRVCRLLGPKLLTSLQGQGFDGRRFSTTFPGR